MKVSLKAMRVNAELNQKQVAKALNVSPNTVVSWEMNKTYPDAFQLTQLCELYRCTTDDIFFAPKTS